MRVDAFGSDPLALRVQVQNNVTDPDGLRVDAAIDGTAGEMAIPTSLTPQRVAMRVKVDGVEVPELHACKVTRSRKQNLQTWEITVPIHSGATGYAGDWRGKGTGLCKKRIDVVGVYMTSTGEHEVELISNGIADNEARESRDGALVTYQGVDAGGRWDKETADLVIPPGSGLTRDRVVEIAARRAGVTDVSLQASDTQMMHGFQMADANFIPPCQELADVEGRVIQWDRQGNLCWPRYGSYAAVPSVSRWSLTERDFAEGSVRVTQPGEFATEITVEGDLQPLQGPCGYTTSRVYITTKSTNPVRAPLFFQEAGSVYTSNPQPNSHGLRTVRQELFETTRWCGIVVLDRRQVMEFYNPEVARYEWSTIDSDWITVDGVYTDDDSDDDSPAYLYRTEKYMVTEEDRTWHYWMIPSLEGPTFPPMQPHWLDLGWGLGEVKGWDGLINGAGWGTVYDPVKFNGLKIGTMLKSKRWYAVRRHILHRDISVYPLVPWEEIAPDDGTLVLGSKEAAVGNAESYSETDQIVTILGTDGRGYQTDEDIHSFGYRARSGKAYRYGDETDRDESEETEQYTGSVYRKMIGNGDEAHDEVESRDDMNAKTFSSVQSIGLPSYLPAAERIPDLGPPSGSDIYVSDAEQSQLYKKAYLDKATPITVTVTDDELESCATRGVHKVTSGYLESEDDADWLARWLLDEGSAARFEGDLAGVNFFIEPGDWCGTVRALGLGLPATGGRVEEVRWEWSAGSPIRTSVTILLYPS